MLPGSVMTGSKGSFRYRGFWRVAVKALFLGLDSRIAVEIGTLNANTLFLQNPSYLSLFTPMGQTLIIF